MVYSSSFHLHFLFSLKVINCGNCPRFYLVVCSIMFFWRTFWLWLPHLCCLGCACGGGKEKKLRKGWFNWRCVSLSFWMVSLLFSSWQIADLFHSTTSAGPDYLWKLAWISLGYFQVWLFVILMFLWCIQASENPILSTTLTALLGFWNTIAAKDPCNRPNGQEVIYIFWKKKNLVQGYSIRWSSIRTLFMCFSIHLRQVHCFAANTNNHRSFS